MRLTLQSEVEFRPPVLGNLDLPEDDQVVVRIRVPTAIEWCEIVHRTPGSPLPTADLLKQFVASVSNLTVEVGGAEVEITDGEKLAAQPSLGTIANAVALRILGLAAAPDPT